MDGKILVVITGTHKAYSGTEWSVLNANTKLSAVLMAVLATVRFYFVNNYLYIMKTLLGSLLIISSIVAQAQLFGKELNKSKKDKARFEELMVEIQELYRQDRYRPHLMSEAQRLNPEDLTLNKIQAVYHMKESINYRKAIDHINIVLAVEADSTWTLRRMQSAYAMYMYRNEPEHYHLFKQDANTMQTVFNHESEQLARWHETADQLFSRNNESN